jgi:hypothetical protein
MKYFTISGIAITVLLSPTLNVLAQSPYDQQPDPYALLNQNPYMQDMQAFQDKYDNIKKERDLERKAIVDQIYAEELTKAKKEQAVQGEFYDAYSASEWAAKQRIEKLGVQWKKEDQELDAQMQEDMMNNTSMGGMYKMQQEMMKQYGYTAPAPE